MKAKDNVYLRVKVRNWGHAFSFMYFLPFVLPPHLNDPKNTKGETHTSNGNEGKTAPVTKKLEIFGRKKHRGHQNERWTN